MAIKKSKTIISIFLFIVSLSVLLIFYNNLEDNNLEDNNLEIVFKEDFENFQHNTKDNTDETEWKIIKSDRVIIYNPTGFSQNPGRSLCVVTPENGLVTEIKFSKSIEYWGKSQPCIKPDMEYVLSGWIKAQAISNLSASIAFILSNEEGAPTNPSQLYHSIFKDCDWEKIVIEFKTPSNAYYGHIELRVYGHQGDGGTGVVWFDDIELGMRNSP